MSPTVPGDSFRLPRVVSPWRPGRCSLASSNLGPVGLSTIWHQPWKAKSTPFALSLFLVALTCTIAFGSSGQISEPPTEAVRSTLTEVFRILEDEKLKDPAKLIPRRHSRVSIVFPQPTK